MVSISNKDGLLMPGMNGEVTIKAADLKNVLQVPIDAIRATNELAPVARMFGIPVDYAHEPAAARPRRTEGTTGIPGRYVVVALPTAAYEMRLVKIGPTDLQGRAGHRRLKEGDKVVMLGAIIAAKPAVPPKLRIADNMKRGAAGVATRREAGDSRSTRAASQPKPAAQAKRQPSGRASDQPETVKAARRSVLAILLSLAAVRRAFIPAVDRRRRADAGQREPRSGIRRRAS